jgi:hypothetical protein
MRMRRSRAASDHELRLPFSQISLGHSITASKWYDRMASAVPPDTEKKKMVLLAKANEYAHCEGILILTQATITNWHAVSLG